jgi:hypothetical protein
MIHRVGSRMAQTSQSHVPMLLPLHCGVWPVLRTLAWAARRGPWPGSGFARTSDRALLTAQGLQLIALLFFLCPDSRAAGQHAACRNVTLSLSLWFHRVFFPVRPAVRDEFI